MVFIIYTAGIYLSLYSLYMLFLLTVNSLVKDKVKYISLLPETRIRIIIPAHNEEIFLPRLLKSLKNQDYPHELFDIVVIADNCTDKTAEIALAYTQNVLERNDTLRIGKGFAIKFAIDNISMNEHDVIFIVDADSVMQRDALKHLDQVVRRGNRIVQSYNGVANYDDSWFTRLMSISRIIGNEIYHTAKEKLGLSSHLMGNGMCFHRDVISKYGWDAFSVAEDWEYYAKIITEGERIAFAKDVRVYHQESTSLRQGTSQRMRWSSGRFAVVWKYGLGLFYRGVLDRNLKKIDASLPLIFPNPSLGINITLIAFALSFLLPSGTNKDAVMLWFSSLLLIQFLIFVAGIIYSQNKLKTFLSLLFAPFFLIWKMTIDILSLFGFGRKKWVRTFRKP